MKIKIRVDRGLVSTLEEDARKREYDRIMRSFLVFDIPSVIRQEIIEAMDSRRWDWLRDCDCCTCVTEIFWPSKYFPPCVRHDYDCRIGISGPVASARFYRIQRAYGVGRVRAGGRCLGVFVAWYTWFKWRRKV